MSTSDPVAGGRTELGGARETLRHTHKIEWIYGYDVARLTC